MKGSSSQGTPPRAIKRNGSRRKIQSLERSQAVVPVDKIIFPKTSSIEKNDVTDGTVAFPQDHNVVLYSRETKGNAGSGKRPSWILRPRFSTTLNRQGSISPSRFGTPCSSPVSARCPPQYRNTSDHDDSIQDQKITLSSPACSRCHLTIRPRFFDSGGTSDVVLCSPTQGFLPSPRSPSQVSERTLCREIIDRKLLLPEL